MFKFIRSLFIILICMSYGAAVSAQDAALLPNAEQTFLTNDGKPLSSGKVYFYIPNTSTLKSTWKDANKNVANTNPIVLDAAGRAIIYGDGEYRQVVKDRNNNQIWDAVTASTGTSGGGGGSTTGDGDLVGTIKPWAGLIAPNQYLFAYGQELSRANYSSLFTAITLTTSVFCSNGSSTLSGIADTTQIPIGSPIEITCMSPGTTVVSKTSSTVVASNNSSLTTSTNAVFLPWGNGNGTTTFNLPDLRGRLITGRNNMGGTASSRLTTTYYSTSPDAIGAGGGSQSHTMTISEMPSHTHTQEAQTPTFTYSTTTANFTTNASPPSAINTLTISTTGGSSTVTTNADTTPGTTGSTGSNTPFSIVQPSITSNYIIKVTPDTAGTTNIGVTAIQSMTGDISCGTGLLCTGNVISVTSSSGTVTSVGLSVPPASIFSVTGTPITSSGTLALTTAGTSGGVPYFSSSSVLSSSFALTANLPIIGGGAGNPPSSGNSTGNTTTFVTSTGSLTSGNCAKWDASGNLVDNGSTCGGGGGGSPGGSNTQVQYNNSGAFGGSANLTWVSPKLTLGAAGSTAGQLAFANATSGSITLQATTGALGSVTLTLPAATDTVGVLAASQAFTNKTYNGNTWTAGTGTLTLAASKTLTVNNTLTISGTDSTTMTFPSSNGTIATLNIASQTITGGVIVTSQSQSTGNITVDCGSRPLQYITNNGAWTITAPANDGSCILLVTNGASAATPTFSGFSVGSNTGDAWANTNTYKFSLHIWRVNGTSGYRIAAHQ